MTLVVWLLVGILITQTGKIFFEEEEIAGAYLLASIFGGVFFVVVSAIFSNGEKKCAWCGSGSLKVISEEEKERFWEYRNKDGSRDQRVKDNNELVKVLKIVACEECGATTQFQYSAARVGQKSKIRKRALVSEGKEARSESDWECQSDEVGSVGAKRKGSS